MSDYYAFQDDELYGYESRGEIQPASFRVTSYELELSIQRQMQAKAVLAIDAPALESYDFTLYHGYKIKSAKDQAGAALRFSQEGDHIQVWNNPDGMLEKIVFEYAGFTTLRTAAIQRRQPPLPRIGN